MLFPLNNWLIAHFLLQNTSRANIALLIPRRATRISSFCLFVFQLETQIPPIAERSSQHWLWLIGLSITAGVILLIILVGVLWCVSIDLKFINNWLSDLPRRSVSTDAYLVSIDDLRIEEWQEAAERQKQLWKQLANKIFSWLRSHQSRMSMCCHNPLTRFLCLYFGVDSDEGQELQRVAVRQACRKRQTESERQTTARTSEAKDMQLMVGEREKWQHLSWLLGFGVVQSINHSLILTHPHKLSRQVLLVCWRVEKINTVGKICFFLSKDSSRQKKACVLPRASRRVSLPNTDLSWRLDFHRWCNTTSWTRWRIKADVKTVDRTICQHALN